MKPVLIFALAVALATAAGSASGAGILPTLYVNYFGTNCMFTMVTDSGATVSSLAPGTYQLTLSADDFTSCPSGLPDFQLSGPGVSIQTPIDAGTGAAAGFTIVLLAGATYVAQDLTQPLSKITFTTQSSGTPVSPTVPYSTTGSGKGTSQTGVVGSSASNSRSASSASTALRGTLAGAVSAAGKPTLTFNGKAVTTLKAGRYKISVIDRSKAGGFIVQEIRASATTVSGVPYVGTRTVTVDLRAGQWFFYPTFVGKKTYFIVTS